MSELPNDNFSRETPRTLIFTQCRIMHDIHGRLMKTALTLAERLNPGVDILLVDNASVLSIEPYLPWRASDSDVDILNDASWQNPPVLSGLRTIGRFETAIGHFNHDRHRIPPPKDGPGRAICTALAIAMASGYDRAVYLESDALVFWPSCRGFHELEQLGGKVGFQPRLPDGYLDNQAWFFADLEWLRTVRAIERYDWPARRGDFTGEPVGERIWELLFAGDLSVLPMRGGRGGMCGFDAGNIRARFPEGIDYLTHVSRAGYAAALEMNGHGDLAPYLMGD